MKHFTHAFLPIGLCAFLLTACDPTEDEGTASGDTNQLPIAIAQAPEQVARQFLVELDATDSRDEDSDNLTYQWHQIAGPDVTEGVGYLTGEQATFYAPEEVTTLQFDLVVNDGTDDSEPDSVWITVFENGNAAYFVDGDLGDDTAGNGSQASPFASIAYALCQLTDAQEDIYVKTRADNAVYDETTDPCSSEASSRATSLILTVPTGTSLYGGFDDNWHRDVTQTTLVDTLHHGFIFRLIDEDTWFSGFNVLALEPDSASSTVTAVSAFSGIASFYVEDNELTAGDVPANLVTNPGSSIAVSVGYVENVSIARNLISAGFGGNASHYEVTYSVAASNGSNGGDASGEYGGNGGDGKGGRDYDGGGGGNRNNDGGDGQGKSSSTQGDDGAIGSGGSSTGNLFIDDNSEGYLIGYQCANGAQGSDGIDGRGGDGGNGGDDNFWGVNGGGGGGGGGGGEGGSGGIAGVGGCASIGVIITGINSAIVSDNTIYSSTGGTGGSGGIGQTGGSGGSAGSGSTGNCGIGGCGGTGGAGGAGSAGGDGGRGGAGGGGPSLGVVVGSGVAPYFENNSITAGNGGQGGDGRTNGNGGDGGHSYAIYDTDRSDGVSPVMTNNTLNSGTASLGGSSSGSKGSAGDSGLTDSVNW